MPGTIVDKTDQRWTDFIETLDRRLMAHPDEAAATRCQGDLTYSARILRNTEGIDVEGTLEYIHAEIGDCDCDVLDIAR